MPAPEPSIDWEFMADFDDDGVYEADLTPYVRKYVMDLGREDALAAFGARTLTVTLGNADSRFSPKNTTGPYAPNLTRGKRCRLRASPGRTFPDMTNLVEDPAIEGSASSYVVRSASIATDSTKAFYGRTSLRVTTTNVLRSGVFVRRVGGVTRFSVTAGSNYSARAMIAAPVGKFIEVTIRWFDAASALIGAEVSVADPEGRGVDNWIWTPQSVLTAPVGAVTAELSIATDAAQGVYDFWVDGVTFFLSVGGTLRPYVDGDQPGCTWAGTPHASQSTRLLTSQQLIPQFTGRIRDFHGSRDPSMWESEIEMECTTEDEAWAHRIISIGPFKRKKANLIVQRLMDVCEVGELWLDGDHRNTPTGGIPGTSPGSPEGESYVGIAGMATAEIIHANMTGLVYQEVLEGDSHMRSLLFGNVIGDGWYVEFAPDTSNSVSYTASGFFYAGTLNAGNRWRFQLWDNVTGMVGETTVTLAANEFVYATVTGTFTAASTQRRVRLIAQDTPDDESPGIVWDGMHLVPTANRIARTVTGLDYNLEVFPQTGFHRSAMAIVEEFCRSAGALMYVDANGGFVFDQTDTARSASAVPELRLTDYTDGFMYAMGGYREGTNNIYNRIRVGSYGNFQDPILSTRRPWAMEPSALVLGNNETRTLYADYATEHQGPIMGVFANAKVALSAGAMVANYPLLRPYGHSAEIVVKAGAAGATITELWVEAYIHYRNTSERTFTEFTPGGSPISAPKFLELEMPGQGYKTAQMTAVATWAGNKYVDGPARLSVEIAGGPVGLDEEGIVGWQYVMEILGREVGTAVWVKHMTGPGALYLDELYYVERRTVIAERNEPPRMRLELEAA